MLIYIASISRSLHKHVGWPCAADLFIGCPFLGDTLTKKLEGFGREKSKYTCWPTFNNLSNAIPPFKRVGSVVF